MNWLTLPRLLQCAAALFFIDALWSTFIQHDEHLFLNQFQVALLFLVLAQLTKQNSIPSNDN
ncbi:hypothetical protein [Alteromonas sp. A079]|uniref:hypothetical protein n=1 Tax=Alteromonas sp. A079 TaxID=3410268 RepID=UPI003BA0F947